MSTETIDNRLQWPLRPWILGIALGITGLLIWLIGNRQSVERLDPWRAAVIGFLSFGSIAAALSVERHKWCETLVFAGIAGLVMAGLAWRAAMGGTAYADPQYGFFAGVVATLLALPLFQAGFHRSRFATPYPTVHEAAWTDALALAGALAFTGAAWLVIALLAQLFHLLKIEFLRDLIKQDWFGWTWSGTAFGAALGVLRNETAILATLQRVAMVVLSILAVPLAAGLALFLVAMVVSGPDVLWEATRSATPVLLLCAAGAWLLANAIIRDSNEDASASPVLRLAAMVLALTVLPLTVFAAVSMGTRIAQHGLSPERIWGLVAIAAACAYGLAWLVAIVRGWKGGAWHARLRQANLHLAVLVCALALILALPIFDFGAVSTRNQLARLESGRVTPAQFDYASLRWDFGVAGQRALAKLAKRQDEVGKRARATQALKARAYGMDRESRIDEDFDLRIQSDDPAFRELVLRYLREKPFFCQSYCVAVDLGGSAKRRSFVLVRSGEVNKVTLDTKTYKQVYPDTKVWPRITPESTIGMRSIEKRYITVDGKPVGPPLDNE